MKFIKLIIVFIVLASGAFWLWLRLSPVARATRALRRGNPGEAIEVLASALEGKPFLYPREKKQEEVLLELLATAYINKGSVDSAEETFKSLHEKNPRNFQALMGLGAISLVHGKSIFGIEYLEEAKKVHSTDFRPYLFLGDAYMARREYKKSENSLIEGLVHFPTSVNLRRSMGDLFFFQGRYNDALNQYLPLLEESPQDKTIRERVGRSYLYSGNIDDAFDTITTLRPVAGTDEGIEIVLSRIYWSQGRRDAAEAVVQRLYNEDNRRFISGMVLAVDLATRDRGEEAGKLLDRIGASLPPIGSPYSMGQSLDDLVKSHYFHEMILFWHVSYEISRARLAQFSCRYGEASNHLNRALSLDSSSFQIYEAAVELARLKGNDEERLAISERATKEFKSHPAAILLRGKALLNLKRAQDTVFDVRSVVDSYPLLSQAQALLARAWLMQKKPQEALRAAERAVQLNEGDPESQLALGLSLWANKKINESQVAFRRSIDIDPRFAEARYEWGTRLNSMGRKNEAKIQLKEAARLEPMVYK